MAKRIFLAVFLGGFLGLAGLSAAPASAQATDTVPVGVPADTVPIDHVDRAAGGLVGPGGPGFRAPEGVGVVSPGALVFASFDANHDGKVSAAEIEAGAPGAFAVADRNGDGAITGFEQNDWAGSMSGLPDILSNPMTFDINLDNSVTRDEFAAGFKRIASQIGPGDLSFADLVRPLNRSDGQAESGPGGSFGTLTPRAGRGTTTRNVSDAGR